MKKLKKELDQTVKFWEEQRDDSHEINLAVLTALREVRSAVERASAKKARKGSKEK